MSMYLNAKFRLNAEKAEEFAPIGKKICEIITERAGWKLVAALSTVTGRLGECVHLWEIPDANAVAELAGKLKPEDYEAVGKFMECVRDEEYQLLSSLDYHPSIG